MHNFLIFSKNRLDLLFINAAWIDFFWHKYARSVIISTEQFEHENREQRRLEAAKNAEKQFKKLILRLIALQFFENSSSCETLLNAAYNIDEDSIDDLIGVYNDSLTEIRSDDQYQINPKTQILIDFPKLITDINNLIYLDKNGIYAEVSGLLSENSHIDKNETTLFESFLAAKVPNDVVLVFYAMLLFLRFYPIQKSENITRVDDISQYAKWIKNLQDWVLAMRNVLLNDNNNQRIDKLFSSFEATQSLKQVLDDLNSFIKDKSLNIYDDDTVILQFFGASNKTYKRLDNQSLDEERKKARLKLDDPTWWTKSIEKVETHTYLWGQIRCLLLWAQNSKHSFEDYGQRLVSLLEAISVSGSKFYAALLAYSPHCWSKTNRLFQYNKDRDNSFKRCLRDSDGQILFKSLIDNWRENYAAKAASDYLNSLIDNGKTAEDIEPWVKCILRYPDIIDYASYKRLFIINGHVVLAQRKTPDSHCIDPIFRFFSILCENKKDPNVQYEIFDSKGAYTHAFEFITHEGIKYLVQWDGSAGEYSIKINDNNPEVHSAQETVAMMEHIIVE